MPRLQICFRSADEKCSELRWTTSERAATTTAIGSPKSVQPYGDSPRDSRREYLREQSDLSITHQRGRTKPMAEAIIDPVGARLADNPAPAYRPGNEADFERLYQASYGK